MEIEKFLLDYDWTVLAPELTILIAATLMSVIDLAMGGKADRRFVAWIGMAGVVVAGLFVINYMDREPYQILADTYRLDDFANVFKLIILAGTLLVLLVSQSVLKRSDIAYRGEFYYLLLTAALGGMMMASSADLITLYVGLELLSISSYILVGTRKHVLKSTEAAFKYVVLGATSSAFILYGMSFAYGLTGTTNLFEMQNGLTEAYNTGYAFFVLLSLVLMLVGIGFKISSAPFHMWAPDVYEGAPTPATTFLAVVSKAAAFALLIRIVLVGYSGLLNAMDQVWMERIGLFFVILAALSMIVGNTAALRQRNVKRMMAYSSIAQAGYILVPFAILGVGLFETVAFYLLAYVFMTVGAFAVITHVNRMADTEDIRSFAGLYRRSPWTAAAMLVFVLSLAGIPLTGGFVGKFYIFFNAIAGQSFWLAGIMVVTTVISYFYYFEIVRQMFFRPPQDLDKWRLPAGVAAAVAIGVVGTVALGVMPQAVFDYLSQLQLTEVLMPAENQ